MRLLFKAKFIIYFTQYLQQTVGKDGCLDHD